jgi:hypothetical protein
VAYGSPEAVCWCLYGLILRALGLPHLCHAVDPEIRSAFIVAAPYDWWRIGFIVWHEEEGRTVDEIIAVCDRVAAS